MTSQDAKACRARITISGLMPTCHAASLAEANADAPPLYSCEAPLSRFGKRAAGIFAIILEMRHYFYRATAR